MNLKSTADAIATRFASLSCTVAGQTETVSGTASLPNNVGKLALLVYPPTAVLGLDVSRRRTDTYDFPVKLLRDPINMPARSDALYAWHDAMRDQVEKNVDLDLAWVDWAQSVSLRMEIDGEQYASVTGSFEQFDVVELIVRVKFKDLVSTVAI